MTEEQAEEIRIKKIVENVWKKYGKDSDGVFDRADIKKFLEVSSEHLGSAK